ncbi:immunoglobulin-binding protein 1 [Ischnura elegans]|uniref:immunoglobulin-binding protein 1 n=1 Tax=Ischnura elegans TaxID=197161 RepID=UPI001ED89A81|nr:immunoglobulin-binding protein 1 [Ischnura elegans]
MKMDESSVSDDSKISDTFEDAFKLFQSIEKSEESSSSPELNAKTKNAIHLFEEATRTVSMLGLFSSNEGVEEIATEDLKFLLLPAFLGALTIRLEQKDRLRHLDAAEIYFKDYLQRCKEYGIANVRIPGKDTDGDDSTSSVTPSGVPPNLMSMVMSRNEKIRRFKEMKELEEHMGQLIKTTNADWSSNEEQRRDYLLTLIHYWVNRAVEELISIENEKPILKHMEEMKLKGKKVPDDDDDDESGPSQRRKPPPLQTVIITKDKVQKAVFGAGYPSIPTYTVDEFYEQRMKSGEFPDPCCRPSQAFKNPAGHNAHQDEGSDDEDRPKTEQEEAEELRRARDFDDYKDSHRRGEGNRHNRS